jgi:hypothetical protein
MIDFSITSFAIGAGLIALVWSFWPEAAQVKYFRGVDSAKELLQHNWDNRTAIEHFYEESFMFSSGDAYDKGYRDTLLNRIRDMERTEETTCKCRA